MAGLNAVAVEQPLLVVLRADGRAAELVGPTPRITG